MSVRSYIPKTACPHCTKFSVRVTCGCDSVFLGRHCNMLSGIVDAVMFLHNRPMSQNQARRYVSSNFLMAASGAKSDMYDCFFSIVVGFVCICKLMGCIGFASQKLIHVHVRSRRQRGHVIIMSFTVTNACRSWRGQPAGRRVCQRTTTAGHGASEDRRNVTTRCTSM